MILRYSDGSGQDHRVIGSAANPSTMVLIARARMLSPAETISAFAIMMLSANQLPQDAEGAILRLPCTSELRAKRRCHCIGIGGRPPLPGRRKGPSHAAAFMDR